ncbi:MAG: DUF2752 domain-containing protein [Polyangiales bacterium]
MPRTERIRASAAERFLWLVLAAVGLSVLSIAMSIEPNPLGFGTHTQLGLPPCGFLSLTGFPCPGCGLTTAFAHGVRGQWVSAGAANPLGLVLFVGTCAGIVVSAVAAYRGLTFGSVFDRLAVDRWALAMAGCGVAIWVARLMAAI